MKGKYMDEIAPESIVGVEDWLEEYIYHETRIRFCHCSIISWGDSGEYKMWIEVSYNHEYGDRWEGNTNLKRWVKKICKQFDDVLGVEGFRYDGMCKGYKLFVAVDLKGDKLWEWITMKKLVG